MKTKKQDLATLRRIAKIAKVPKKKIEFDNIPVPRHIYNALQKIRNKHAISSLWKTIEILMKGGIADGKKKEA